MKNLQVDTIVFDVKHIKIICDILLFVVLEKRGLSLGSRIPDTLCDLTIPQNFLSASSKEKKSWTKHCFLR